MQKYYAAELVFERIQRLRSYVNLKMSQILATAHSPLLLDHFLRLLEKELEI